MGARFRPARNTPQSKFRLCRVNIVVVVLLFRKLLTGSVPRTVYNDNIIKYSVARTNADEL